jgi:uncharacterized RDD family membrane protein YckC
VGKFNHRAAVRACRSDPESARLARVVRAEGVRFGWGRPASTKPPAKRRFHELEDAGTQGAVGLAPAAGSSLSRRAAAFGIDLVLVATISLAVSIGLHLLLILFAPALLDQERWVIAGAFAACSAAYFVGFWTREGATPGQHIMGLRLALAEYPDNPGPIGAPRAIVRFAAMVGGGILLLDFIVAFLHRERRSLHDLASGTIVASQT